MPEALEEFNQYSKFMKNLTFFRKTSLWNFFIEHVYCSFVNSIGNFATQNREVFAPPPMMLNFLKKLSLSPKISGGHLESRVHKTAGKVSTEKVPLNKTIWWREK